LEEELLPVLDAEEGPGREVAYDGFDKLVGGERVPDEVSLEIWECHLAVVDHLKQETQRFGRWVRVLHVMLP
jgi:hypothetical protein